jgi:hypothetical protein
MTVTDASTATARRRLRATIRAKLDDLSAAERILTERGDEDGATIMRTVRTAWHALCIAPRVTLPGEDPNDLSEQLRWSPVTKSTHAYALAVIASANGGPAPRTKLLPETIKLAVPR